MHTHRGSNKYRKQRNTHMHTLRRSNKYRKQKHTHKHKHRGSNKYRKQRNTHMHTLRRSNKFRKQKHTCMQKQRGSNKYRKQRNIHTCTHAREVANQGWQSLAVTKCIYTLSWKRKCFNQVCIYNKNTIWHVLCLYHKTFLEISPFDTKCYAYFHPFKENSALILGCQCL